MIELSAQRLASLSAEIKRMGVELGFQNLAIADINLEDDHARLEHWLALGRHGEMEYMRRHGRLRGRPEELVPNTIRVISARMDYWPAGARGAEETLGDRRTGYVARYALGRDYHKVLRARLKRLAGEIESVVGEFGYRVFVDSAPVLEKALARNAGIGWIGKHTNVIDRRAGSWFFLGEIFTDFPLPTDRRVGEHCGSCTACLDICPTSAIVAPYELDARRCISYLTIEYKGIIPIELRPLIGNRIFGCDDCQLVCPWNRYARATAEPDFKPRHGLDSPQLVELLGWSETTWRRRTEGSALRRPGYLAWLRNVAVALGNASTRGDVLAALRGRASHPSELVREHVKWALDRHEDFAQ